MNTRNALHYRFKCLLVWHPLPRTCQDSRTSGFTCPGSLCFQFAVNGLYICTIIYKSHVNIAIHY